MTKTARATEEWAPFAGGELEGKRPKTLCAECRERLKHAIGRGDETGRVTTLCFQCYRAEIDRERALRAAGALDTASVERFQSLLPFEPVNRARLDTLKAERMATRALRDADTFEGRRRQAQIAARRAVESARALPRTSRVTASQQQRAIASAIHAAELQLPESWMPFVVGQASVGS
jgi:hypothetical protein